MTETSVLREDTLELLQICAINKRLFSHLQVYKDDFNNLVDAYARQQERCTILEGSNNRLSAQMKEVQGTLAKVLGENKQLQREKAALETKLRAIMIGSQEERRDVSGQDVDSTGQFGSSSSIDYTTTDCSLDSLGLANPQFSSKKRDLGSMGARKSVRALKANNSAAKPPRIPSIGCPGRQNADEGSDCRGRSRDFPRKSRRSSSVPVRSPHRLRSDHQLALPPTLHATSEERLNEIGIGSGEEEENSLRSNDYDDVLSSDRSQSSSLAFTTASESAGEEEGSEGGGGVHVMLQERPHNYVEKRVMLRDICDMCGNGLGFGATSYKCTECKQVAHHKCMQKHGGLPCLPRPTSKKTATGGKKFALHEWCSDTATPMVPFVVVACVLTIERTFMSTAELHRVPSTMSGAALLRELRPARSLQIINERPAECISSALKQFLKELAKPVVHDSSLAEMISVNKSGMTRTEKATRYERIIDEMSRPHRDTFAFVARHLQRVADVKANKMSVANLVGVFASLLMDANRLDLMNQQRAVLTDLLTLVKPAFYDALARCGVLAPPSAAAGMSTLRRRERALETPRAGTTGFSLKGMASGTPKRPAESGTKTRQTRRRLMSDDQENPTQRPMWK